MGSSRSAGLLQIAPRGYRRHAAQLHTPALCSQRTQRDAALVPHIERVWRANLQVYGAKKVWQQPRAVQARLAEGRVLDDGLRVLRRGSTAELPAVACLLEELRDLLTQYDSLQLP